MANKHLPNFKTQLELLKRVVNRFITLILSMPIIVGHLNKILDASNETCATGILINFETLQ
jgi:hypothetical protein